MIITVMDVLPFDLLCAFNWSNLGSNKFDFLQNSLRQNLIQFRILNLGWTPKHTHTVQKLLVYRSI